MRSLEFSGHSVDEAIFIGLNEMGVTIDEVEIETIQSESKGLFGIGLHLGLIRQRGGRTGQADQLCGQVVPAIGSEDGAIKFVV